MTARLEPGSVFAGYRIESLAGRGGMGVVYRATDLSLARPVALKLIAPELAGDRRFRERFLQEPRLAASLDHSSVIPIYEAGEHDGQLYLAMRYVPGSDLATLLRREGALEPERALAILGQIAGALDAAHRRGLVHRDVKPANVLLDEDEHAYLTDFGVTRQLGDDDGEAAGTLDYLAPEQIRGDPVDGRTDGYALACMLYECLAGSPPFRRQTASETMWAHLRGDIPSLEGQPALDPVLQTGLAHDRDDRYPTCAALIEAARDVLVPRSHTGRLLAVMAVGVVALAAALAAALLTEGGSDGGAAALKAPSGNGIAAIGPSSARIASFVQTAAAPSNVAAGEGAVWFLDTQTGTVSRTDPETHEITGRTTSPGVATDLAAGGGAVWLGTGGGAGGNWTRRVHRIDPQTLEITGSVRLPKYARGGELADVNGGFTQIAVGAGSVWATGGGDVARIDPRTGRRVARVKAAASRIAAGREGVWFVSGHEAGTVTRINTRTNRTRMPIRLGDAALSGIAVGDGSVWVTAQQEGILWRITPGAGTIPIDVDEGAGHVAYGAGAVWVGNYLDGTVSKVDPRTNAVVAKTPIGAIQSLAAGAGSAWAGTAGGTRSGTLPASACDVVPGGGRPDVLIASDLPIQGSYEDTSRANVEAIRTVLAEHGFRAGKYAVGYRSCDDSSVQTGTFDPRRCAANANAYANAADLVAVIGPYNSDCAHIEVPILNRAPGGPLAMISTNSDTALTRTGVPTPFGYRGTPEIFYPIGTRHYVRLISPETLWGAGHAMLSKQLGLESVYLLQELVKPRPGERARPEVYFKTTLIDPFRQAARRLGVRIAGSAAVDPYEHDMEALADRIERSGADGVVLGALPFGPVMTKLLPGLRARLGPKAPIMVGAHYWDGLATADHFKQAGPAMRNVYVATLDLPRTVRPLTAAARRIAPRVAADVPGVLEVAQATELVLRAIAASDGTRASVLDRLRRSQERHGILGTFRFDDKGDMTPGYVTILRITAPAKSEARALEGAVVDRAVRVPPAWTE
jgi:ABC-type branched-subunit amino acid transport system substrate-binding protein/streptogramin lyase